MRSPLSAVTIALMCVMGVLVPSVIARDFARVLRDRAPGVGQGTARNKACVTELGTIPHGQRIPTDNPCENCKCSDGNKVCRLQKCQVPKCVDAARAPGVCCESCPNGQTCLLDGEVVSGWRPIIQQRGPCTRYCSCPTSQLLYLQGGKSTEASCVEYCTEDEGGVSLESEESAEAQEGGYGPAIGQGQAEEALPAFPGF